MTMPTQEKQDLLMALWGEYAACELCALAHPEGRDRRHMVFGSGNPDAKVVIIDEAPDEHEDASGKIFSGNDGALLDSYLAGVHSSRAEVFLLKAVGCRATRAEDDGYLRHRPAAKEEVQACQARLHRVIEIIDPYVLLVLGNTAIKALLKVRPSVTSMARNPTVPTYDAYTQGQCTLVKRTAYVSFPMQYLLRPENAAMEHGSDRHHAFRTWLKAFQTADMYHHIYTGATLPTRGE